MNVELQLIESLDDIDFDYLFRESFSRIELNFIWPPGIDNYEKKRDYYRWQLEAAITGDWRVKNDDDIFLMIATKVDGVVVEFSAGHLETDGSLSLQWNLTAPVPGGNRNWRYSPEAQQARKDFAVSIGSTAFKEYTWVGSLLYRTLKSRTSAGGYTIEEILTHLLPTGKQMVTLIIRFN